MKWTAQDIPGTSSSEVRFVAPIAICFNFATFLEDLLFWLFCIMFVMYCGVEITDMMLLPLRISPWISQLHLAAIFGELRDQNCPLLTCQGAVVTIRTTYCPLTSQNTVVTTCSTYYPITGGTTLVIIRTTYCNIVFTVWSYVSDDYQNKLSVFA